MISILSPEKGTRQQVSVSMLLLIFTLLLLIFWNNLYFSFSLYIATYNTNTRIGVVLFKQHAFIATSGSNLSSILWRFRMRLFTDFPTQHTIQPMPNLNSMNSHALIKTKGLIKSLLSSVIHKYQYRHLITNNKNIDATNKCVENLKFIKKQPEGLRQCSLFIYTVCGQMMIL